MSEASKLSLIDSNFSTSQEMSATRAPMNHKRPTIRLHLWLETIEGVFFGSGRVFLLKGIEEHGSLKKAAEAMGMSYRAAWGKIKATEKVLGVQLIEKQAGNKCGYTVTEEGRVLMEKFEQWFFRVEEQAALLAEDIFPFKVRRFKAKASRS